MSGVKPALQKRSKETRDRLIAALDRLLRTQPFEDISVASIAEEAGLSVGAVYRRFENKDAFVPVLFDLYRNRLAAFVDEQRGDAQSAPADLHGALRRALLTAAAIIEREGHLLRAVHLYARIRPDLVGGGWEPFIDASRASIRALLEEHADDVTTPDRGKAVEALTYFLNTILIEDGLFGHIGQGLSKLRGAALAVEMADFAYGYLTMDRSL